MKRLDLNNGQEYMCGSTFGERRFVFFSRNGEVRIPLPIAKAVIVITSKSVLQNVCEPTCVFSTDGQGDRKITIENNEVVLSERILPLSAGDYIGELQIMLENGVVRTGLRPFEIEVKKQLFKFPWK